MRRFAGVVALLTLVSSAAFADGAVEVAAPQITVFDYQRIQKECAAGKRVNACMKLDALLYTTCKASDGMFRIAALARLSPRIYTIGLNMLPHEVSHLADFVHQLKMHNEKLEKPLYESLEACEATARVAQMTFGQKLRSYQQASAHKRDRREPATVAALRRASAALAAGE